MVKAGEECRPTRVFFAMVHFHRNTNIFEDKKIIERMESARLKPENYG